MIIWRKPFPVRLHHYTTSQKDGFPTIPVEKPFAESKAYWQKFIKDFPGVLYTPNISMGWDASPRCMPSDKFEMGDYPWTPVFTGNTPASFQMQLQEAKEFLDTYNPKHKIVVLNSWNEWTALQSEGQWMLPALPSGVCKITIIPQQKNIPSG